MQAKPASGLKGTERVLLPKAERHAAILKGAATAFAQSGFAATSMDDVAAASGITKLIVYRHFDSKDELYRAVLQQVSERLVTEIAERVRQGDRRGIAPRALLIVARENPDGFALLMRHAIREAPFADYVLAFHRQAVAVAHGLVAGPRGAGTVLADAGFDEWAAETVVAHIVDAVLQWVERGDPARDEEFVAMVTDGLLALVGAWGSAISG